MKLQYITLKVDLACEVGLPESIILGHFHYWLTVNESDPAMNKGGRVWLYASRKAIQTALPFLSDKVIRNSIDRLIEAGWLVKGDYNLSMTQKANWYSFSEKAIDWYEGKAPLAQTASGLAQTTNVKENNKDNILSIEEKRRILAERCEPFVAQYGRQMIDAFVSYWGEANGNRLRCEIAKQKSGAFEISRRLATWASKEYNQPRKPVTPASAPSGRPIWESLGMTREQYIKMQGK